ncbi:peroxisomal membrane anchor protein conserved region-domain-containing protein [Phyllosticta capitalensis]|uniref:peroxisomal membrane anchor protein conserved region-domain-containing protein n=1 Tax=Phyllosticta capitalensis TaxID=121624 RepID=UPI003130D6D4
MVREDLISSAVTFLQDPSVASAPVEKRIAFLQSKNLTQEEIDASLARAGEAASASVAAPTASSPAPQSYGYQQPPPPPPGYGAYPSYWPQPPPPVPKRDWRDWFIMATVMGGVGYGLYFTAKRYIYPLIAPPTPPQLEQDKTAVDESFNKAFELLEQLNTDTTALKAAEEDRTKRLDSAISDMETAIEGLKESLRRRDVDSRRMEDDVKSLRDLIPKALESHKESTDNRLKDLSQELKSLKTLVGNRMGGAASSGINPPSRPGSVTYGATGIPSTNGSGTPGSSIPMGPVGGSGTALPQETPQASSPAQTPGASNTSASTPYSSRFTSGRASIPAWQMAASKKNEEKKDTSESGTVTEASPGA